MRRLPVPAAILLLGVVASACAGRPASTTSTDPSPSAAGPSDPASQAETPIASPDPTAAVSEGLSGQLAYVSGDDPQLFLLDLATGESRRLTHLTPEHAELTSLGPYAPVVSCAFGPQGLTWSPDGNLLAFSYGSCESVVYVVDLDGHLTRIGDGRSPAWSPDGRRLVFAPNSPFCMAPDCGEQPAPGAWNLQVADIAEGAVARPLMVADGMAFSGQPTFSPDGALIAFTAPLPEPQDDPELFGATYVVRADGSDPRLVARGAWPPGWLPDGRLLLVDERSSELRALDLESADATPLAGSLGPALVSPDATRLLLVTFDEVDGTESVQLATLEGDVLASYPGWPAAWAPDGRAAVVVERGGSALVVIDRAGDELARYPLPPSALITPTAAWRPGT